MGLPEIVEHQRTGLLVENENSTALAEAMRFLLDRIPAASQMGQEARKRVQTMYGWESCVDAYDALYRQLIKNKCGSSALQKVPQTTNPAGV